jgi:hypothetical protein
MIRLCAVCQPKAELFAERMEAMRCKLNIIEKKE